MKKVNFGDLTKEEQTFILDDCTLQNNNDYYGNEVEEHFNIYNDGKHIRAVQKDSKFLIAVYVENEKKPSVFIEDVEGIESEKDLTDYFSTQYENDCDVRVTAHTPVNGIVFTVEIPKMLKDVWSENRTLITNTDIYIK